ncbi:MAG: Na/Pi cotransporter family protein [Candidatus Coatesbacteria bacterium]|nr:Na/Pi cotransporter family protein [Candidatus Coatesbacteria bacterium]
MALNLGALRKKIIGLAVVGSALSLLWVTGIWAGLWRLRDAVDPVPLLFGVFGGLGLFIFGIQIMSDSLQKAAGRRLRRILELLAGGPIRGVLVGAGITALIQSSSATTVMVVGFVNAGLMTLVQAIGVILGANIGTTITAQIIAFNISRFALPAIAVGVAMTLTAKHKEQVRLWGNVILGFGVLFYGLTTMVSVLKPLRGSEQFQTFFLQFGDSPILGVLAGAMLTAVVQSSSATVGLVIALGTSGLVDFRTALPLLVGDNIGTTVTALLSSIGANRDARRAALAHFLFNFLGAVWVLAVLSHFARLVDYFTAGNADSPAHIARHIANAHTMFNVLNTIVVLPFVKWLARLVTWIIPEKAAIPAKTKVGAMLQDRFLDVPPVAIAQIKKAILHMFDRSQEMLSISTKMIDGEDLTHKTDVFRLEDELDRHQAEITEYISLVMQKGVSAEDGEVLTHLLHAVNDVENIGDKIVNVTQLLGRLKKLGQTFSPPARADLVAMSIATHEMAIKAFGALSDEDEVLARAVLKRENRIDEMKRVLRRRNRDRYVAFKRGQSETEEKLWGQVISNDIISNLEGIGDSIVNVLEAFELAIEEVQPFMDKEAI